MEPSQILLAEGVTERGPMWQSPGSGPAEVWHSRPGLLQSWARFYVNDVDEERNIGKLGLEITCQQPRPEPSPCDKVDHRGICFSFTRTTSKGEGGSWGPEGQGLRLRKWGRQTSL